MINFRIETNIEKQKNEDKLEENDIIHRIKSNYFVKNILYEENLKKFDQYKENLSKIKEKFKNIIIIGIGGSINAFIFLSEFIKPKDIKKFYIIKSYLYEDLENVLKNCNLSESHIFAITKSGKSREIEIQSNIIIDKMISGNMIDIEKHFTVISTESGLNRIEFNLDKKKVNFIDYDENISGRFSCFSNPLLCPAFFFDNFDINKYLDGAKSCIEDFFNKKENYETIKNYSSIASANQLDTTIISYNESVCENFFLWYQQIIAESTGKNGKGFNPICTYGFRDQHSQFQLFLDGQKNKTFTFIGYDENFFEDEIKKSFYAKKGIHFYKNAVSMFKEKNLPFRNLILNRKDEKNLGYLLSYFCIETIYMCEKTGVNPFDQNQIEKFKNNLL